MQVVGYDRLAPALVVAEDGATSEVALTAGRELTYALGERYCAGTVVEGRHEPCDRSGTPRCEAHAVPWSVASNADSDEEHAVYLAAFAPDTFKVGVTRTWRLETRLREQGADRGAHVYTAPDGRVARELESDVARETPVPERVRVAEKIAGLGHAVDEDAWTALLDGFEVYARFAFDYGLELSGAPVPETMLTGTVRGTKGRVLVLDRGGTSYAVDMRELVGHELREGTDDRDRQSSLGAFG